MNVPVVKCSREPSSLILKLVEVFSLLMEQLKSGTPDDIVRRNCLARSGSRVMRRKSSTNRIMSCVCV